MRHAIAARAGSQRLYAVGTLGSNASCHWGFGHDGTGRAKSPGPSPYRLRRRLDLPVGQIGIAQSHLHLGLAEQPCDDRYGNAVHHSLPGSRTGGVLWPQVMPHAELPRCGHVALLMQSAHACMTGRRPLSRSLRA